MKLQIKATRVFQDNWEALNSTSRFIVNQGGSRSSKTYSICQALVLYCIKNPGTVVSLIRKTSPALMATAVRDLMEILDQLGLYKDSQYNRVERIYRFDNKSMIEFFSADDPQKLRGRKRDIAWVNEANELTYEDFQQLNLRTTNKIVVDYNPSEADSYLYHFDQDNTTFIHSTYKDNPFLEQAIIDQIENYKYTDLDYYTIFALGERAYSRENVYQQWQVLDTKPEDYTKFIYAIDYGYQHPTAMVKIWYTDRSKKVFIEEVLYESHLTSSDIVAKMELKGVDKSVVIIAETARPEITADIRRAGYKVVEAVKDVIDGINNVKTFEVSIASSATNIIKENINYKYKKHNGVITEQVIKLFDDAMDAIRYGLMYVKKHLIQDSVSPTKIYSFKL